MYYGINLADGSKIPLGRYDAEINEILADIYPSKVDYGYKIQFNEAGGAKYDFDSADDVYKNNNIYSSHYNKLEDSDGYKLRWKFMQVGGGTDKVTVEIPPEIERNNETLKFIITQNNTELAYTEGTTDDISLTLMPPSTAGVYSILAVVKAPKDGVEKWNLAGRLDVLAREPKTYSVTLVPLAEDHSIDKDEVRNSLNSIWKQYGISWEVDVDNKFYVDADETDYNKLFIDGFTDEDWATAWEEGDEFFSQYTSIQNDINRRYNTYAKGINIYDDTHMYVFILPENKTREPGQIGDMPLGKQWGYLFVDEFGSDEHYRTLSHELGHGRTALHHTFEGGYLDKYDTQNLMDYVDPSSSPLGGGWEGALVRAQWDMVHSPARFTPLQSDEDGAFINQLVSMHICTQKFIEQFRWAYVNSQELEYESIGAPYYTHFAKNITLAGIQFKEISVEIRQDIGFVPTYQKYVSVYGRAEFSYGSVLKIISYDKPNDASNYLYPSKAVWDNQIDELKDAIYIETNRTELLKKLAVYPHQEFVRFSPSQRHRILNLIAEGSITEDYISCRNDEEIVIHLVKHVPDEHLSELFITLQQNNLMQTLCGKIQNVFGAENYTRFIAALTSSFWRHRHEDMAYVKNNWEAYTYPDANWREKQTHFIWDRTFSSDEMITYRWEYENNKIIFTTWPGSLFDKYSNNSRFYAHTRPPLDPFDIVTVYYHTQPKHISENMPADTWMAMPAFMFEWSLNEFYNKQFADFLDGSVNVASLIIPFAGTVNIPKLLFWIQASINLDNVFLINNTFSDIVKDNFSPEVIETWEDFKYLFNVVASPLQDLIYEDKVQKSNTFIAAWNIFKSSDEYSYLMNSQASKEAIIFTETFMDLFAKIE